MSTKQGLHPTKPVIAFDIGGVIIPYLDDIIDTQVRDYLKVDQPTFDSLWQRHVPDLVTGQITERVFWNNIEQELDRKLPAASTLLIQPYIKHLSINHELLNILDNLRNRHKLVVFSNTIAVQTAYNRRHGLYEKFDAAYLSDEIGYMKPDEAFYDFVLAALNVLPQQIMFFDDMPANVSAARAKGIDAHVYTSNATVLDHLPALS